ncbi:MAG: right-handed parallel beta-helix repeat-containing protein [Thermomicrobiales bacterium]
MDGGSFDRWTRLLAERLTRRSGLATTAAAGVAAALGVAAEDAAAGKDGQRHRGRHQAGAAGPCGPTGKDNICTKDKECCTGYCKPGKPGKAGRCRCVKMNKKCKKGQQCCGGGVCQNKTCKPPVPPCGATGVACTADADCCSGLVCFEGQCGPCIPTVCSSCTHKTVEAAYAAATSGDTIYIGSGTYPTEIIIDKSITLAACPGVTDVVLQTARVNIYDSYFSILLDSDTDTTPYAVGLRNLTLEGTYPTNRDDALLRSTRSEYINWTVEECTVRNAYYGLYVLSGQHVINRSKVEGCQKGVYVYYGNVRTDPMSLIVLSSEFTGNDSYTFTYAVSPSGPLVMDGCNFHDNNDGYDLYYYGASPNKGLTPVTITNTTVANNGDSYTVSFSGGVVTMENCSITNTGYSGLYASSSDVTLIDTEISGNTSSAGGGGIYLNASGGAGYEANLTLEGTTTVTGNTATTGAGIYGYSADGVTNITVTGGSRVSGNIGNNQCFMWVNGVWNAPVNCATWTS